MDTTSTIRAFQGVVSKFVFKEPRDFPEAFAQKRYLKKMETPSKSNEELRSQQCWERWISLDGELPKIVQLPEREWYLARDLLHKSIRNGYPRTGPIDFPKGSEVISTSGNNSIESRLCSSKWTCTHDNFEEFSSLVYHHKALKRAFRKRYSRWFLSHRFDMTMKESDSFLYKEFSLRENKEKVPFSIFKWKLERVIQMVRGSRFSTVPKNNEKDRPINLEPLGNQLVQRRIGNKIRILLKREFNNDLDFTADYHRDKISDPSYSTIDLSDASDSVSLALCHFLLPKSLMTELLSSRSQMIYGLDGNYHVPLKISSMGNGFTFELMTLILTSLCKVLDPSSSVFGDDIIIRNESADRLVQLLESVGFTTNKEKSFIRSPFRESCGSNFHDDFGYIESYDFKYPQSIGDCVVLYNKAKYLSLKYNSFQFLERTLYGFIPKVLRGGPLLDVPFGTKLEVVQADRSVTYADTRPLSNYFMTGDSERNADDSPLGKKEIAVANLLQYSRFDIRAFIGFHFIPTLRTPTLKHLSSSRNWAKYEMYLHGMRKTEDIISGDGRWVTVVFIAVHGKASRLSRFTR